jgi:hypothetical protein
MKNLILLLTIFATLNCKPQEKEVVYIIYESGAKKNCDFSMFRDGSNKNKVLYKDQKIIKEDGTIIFIMCKSKFICSSFKNSKTINNIEELNIVDMNYMYSETEKDWPNTAKDLLFRYIYILEKTPKGNYIEYEVKWTDSF